MNAEWFIALVGVLGTLAGALVGAIASGVVNYRIWKRQHQEMLRASADRERREQRVRATDRLQEVADQLMELGAARVSGPHIDQAQLSTVTYMEMLRLRRELFALINLTRGLFENEETRRLLTIFQGMVSQAPLLGQSSTDDQMKRLRSELEAVCARLREEAER